MIEVESRALELIDLIYQAASEPAHWQEVAQRLSSNFGGAAVSIGMGLRSENPSERIHFSAGLGQDFGEPLQKMFEVMPVDDSMMSAFTERFRTLDAVLPELGLTDTGLYQNWMKPHGLEPIWPMGHIIFRSGGRSYVVIAIFRRAGGGEFTSAEFSLVDRLVPHLARAFQLYGDLDEIHRERRAIEEAIDRLRVGVVLTNVNGRPVFINQSAKVMFDQGTVIAIADGMVTATDEHDNDTLQEAMSASASKRASSSLRLGANRQESGVQSLQIIVSPLPPAPPGNPTRDAVTALLIAGPEAISGTSLRFLKSLYGLTDAETELVALLSRGASVERAARERGVSQNTARSQLKQVFAKTGTNRQSALIRLVFTGLSPMQDE